MRVVVLRLFWLLALIGSPGWAQPAAQCTPPARIDPPHAVTASPEEPARREAIAGYTLALSWVSEYCHAAGLRDARPEDRFQCGGQFAGRFVLHGLWPDGPRSGSWPQYCRAVGIVPPATLRANLCLTPSAQLLQHEWAKHGSCMADRPDAYFAAAARAYRAIVIPDMRAFAGRRSLRAADLQRAFAAANPGMPAAAFRIGTNRRGWLEDVRICLDRGMRPRACLPDARGAPRDDALRIEWGGRAPRSSRFRDGGDRGGAG